MGGDSSARRGAELWATMSDSIVEKLEWWTENAPAALVIGRYSDGSQYPQAWARKDHPGMTALVEREQEVASAIRIALRRPSNPVLLQPMSDPDLYLLEFGITDAQIAL